MHDATVASVRHPDGKAQVTAPQDFAVTRADAIRYCAEFALELALTGGSRYLPRRKVETSSRRVT